MTSVMIMTTPGDGFADPLSLRGFNFDLAHHHWKSATEADVSIQLTSLLSLYFSFPFVLITSSSSVITLSRERPRSSSSETSLLRQALINEQQVRVAKDDTDSMIVDATGTLALKLCAFSVLGLSISLRVCSLEIPARLLIVPSDDRLLCSHRSSARDPARDLDRDPGRVATLLTVSLNVSTRSSMLDPNDLGRIVASSGLSAGIDPVMIHKPASATDQLKYSTSSSSRYVSCYWTRPLELD